ncbi:hypothetical protein AAFG22_14900 [Bradyrhizobium sp. B024]|uniref:hypothetical protein n=1 Tax=Bradyrhizobium sp. B024 TaxID=3140247 RepID=UPI003183729F
MAERVYALPRFRIPLRDAHSAPTIQQMETVVMKQCRRCEQDLPLSSFGYGGRSRLRKFCHGCFSAIVNGEVFTMNPREAATFMARLEAGHSLRMLTGGVDGEPIICSAAAFYKHCELHPEWGARALPLVKANARSRVVQGAFKRYEGRTTCFKGHPLTAEIIKRMNAERRYSHQWCQTCVRHWRGFGRYLAEDANVIEPPRLDGPITLSGGSRYLTAADVALIEEWLNKGASLRKLLRAWDFVRLKLYRKSNSEWDAKFKPIIERNAKIAVAYAARQNRHTHCPQGHEYTEESTHINTTNGTRSCAICNRAYKGAPVTSEMIHNAERGLLTGMKVSQLTKPMGGRRSILTPMQWRVIRTTRPDINERFIRAARNPATIRGLMGADKGLILDRPAEVVPASDIPLYIPEDGDFEWLYSFAPRNLQRDTRNDIVADLWAELAGRRVSRAGVPALAREIVAKYKRENPMKAYGDIRTPLPLDAPAYLDGTMSHVEIVSESLWS